MNSLTKGAWVHYWYTSIPLCTSGLRLQGRVNLNGPVKERMVRCVIVCCRLTSILLTAKEGDNLKKILNPHLGNVSVGELVRCMWSVIGLSPPLVIV